MVLTLQIQTLAQIIDSSLLHHLMLECIQIAKRGINEVRSPYV